MPTAAPSVLAFFVISIASHAAAQQASGYIQEEKDGLGRLYGVVFRGDADWLSRQDDPASHIHLRPNVSALTLASHAISGEEMDYVTKLQGVKSLSVGSVTWGLEEDRPVVGTIALSKIKRMEWLKQLEIDVNMEKQPDWTFLRKLKKLEVIRVGPGVAATDSLIEVLEDLPALKEIDLRRQEQLTVEGKRRLEVLRSSEKTMANGRAD